MDLNRQVERASLFTHTALSNSFARIGEIQVLIRALVTLLLEKGLITDPALQTAVTDAREMLSKQGLLPSTGVAIRVDSASDQAAAAVPVDCAARIHICRAVCCQLNFALSVPEIEAGHAKWDLGRPYFIRQAGDHCCTHLDRQTRGCGIYEDRPGACRRYSCANDSRIWKDFNRMILNEEWIGTNLSDAAVPRLEGTFMISPNKRAG